MSLFRLFPVTITPDGRKVPLIRDWQTLATRDPEQIKLWQELFRGRLKYWGVPTGPEDDLLVLDLDVKHDGPGHIQRLGFVIPDTMWQRTRSGGYHFFFRYPKDGKRYGNRTNLFGNRELSTGIDVRGAGGYICFYGCDPMVIADPPPWFLEAINAREQIQVTGEPVKIDPQIASPIIIEALDNIRNAGEGESNNTLNVEAFRLGQLVAAGSVTREYCEAVLLEAAKERGKQDHEARATIRSGLDGGSKKPLTSPFGSEAPPAATQNPFEPPARWTPTHSSRQDLLNVSKLRKPQLFQDWSTEDITLTTGDGGTGKSTLKIQEAVCLALGERFLGFPCNNPGKTLYITGEDTKEKLAAILGAIVRQMGLLEPGVGNESKVQTILDSVLIKKDADFCLISQDRQGFLHPNSEAIRKLNEAVEDINPKMIVFDPISSFWGSEQKLNDMNKAVTRFASIFAEKGICFEMINHMGKSSSASKDITQFAGRGGSGLPSNSRVVRVLHAITDEEYMDLTGEQLLENQSVMRCVINKFSDGSPLLNKPFLIVREGFLFHRKNLTQAKAREAEKNLSDIERVFAYVQEQRSNDKYPSRKVVQAQFMMSGDPLSEARTKRALDMLIFQGHMGSMIKEIENPDVTVKERVLIITDENGKES